MVEVDSYQWAHPKSPSQYMARIALVEDESIVSKTLERMLARVDHQTATFISADEVLAKCDFTQVDLVITDLIMGVRSKRVTQGEELIAVLRREQPQLPILVVTGAVSEWVDRLQALGDTRVLRKPFEPKELIEAVAELVSTGSQAMLDKTNPKS